jgi:hypothetical protein
MIARTSWDELPDEIRDAVSDRTGPILSVRNASAGQNSAIAIILHTATATVFVKGLRKDHPAVVAQSREAAINPYIRHVGPTLLWHAEVDAWDLLGFAYLDGRHADYRPGASDPAKIVTTIGQLAGLPCPPPPSDQARRAALGLLH